MLHIGGFQKNSLIDFPGQIACVVFTQGCNFICPYCHNPDLVAGPEKGAGSPMDETAIFSFLVKRKVQLGGVAVTGGEPTLQKDLAKFLEQVKSLGYRVKLDTNGTRPKVLADLFEKGLVDYLAMDIKTRLSDYPQIAKGHMETACIRESIELVMEKATSYEFRTTCIRPFVSKAAMADIAEAIKGASKYVLQPCSSNVRVLEPGFIEDKTRFFSKEELLDLQRIASATVETVLIR